MIDELMDSLVLDKLPTRDTLESNLSELARGAEDIEPILHSFKNAQVLRVGVRDILGKEDIVSTCRALADIAEVCLRLITAREYAKLASKFGKPMIPDGDACRPDLANSSCWRWANSAAAKSTTTAIWTWCSSTRPMAARSTSSRTTPQRRNHHQSAFLQRAGAADHQSRQPTWARTAGCTKSIPGLRPTGKSGALATSLAELRRYFDEGQRPALGTTGAVQSARGLRLDPRRRQRRCKRSPTAPIGRPWQREYADEIRHMRHRMEETAKPNNLKRGPGGLVDVEFIAQMLQLKHGDQHPEVRMPGTLRRPGRA